MYKKISIAFILISSFLIVGFEFEGVLVDFKAPIIGENGQINGQISGGSGEIIKEGVLIKDSDSLFKSSQNIRQWQLKTPECIYNQNSKRVHSHQRAELLSNGIIIDGEGLVWYLDREMMVFKRNVTMDIIKDQATGGLKK